MEKEGYVSLWIGNIKSDRALSEYVELIYTDDGDCVPSLFLQDFNIDIDDFDEDFIERICTDKQANSITGLISGCSYEDVVIPKFEKLSSIVMPSRINAGILLYNFQYDGSIRDINKNGYEFKFVGSVEYVK
ncbi:immunity 22 family protein [Clostridiaceae bacterium UIB06]|nr:immunity 22 family protein [Clostridiaceae bacterium UIB06]